MPHESKKLLKEYKRKYYQENKERLKVKHHAYYYSNRDKCIKKNREKYRDNKIKCLSHYSGGVPICKCGVSDLRALSIDHINGGGKQHKGGSALYSWLIKNKFPPEFQVLCMNCQFIKKHENKEWGSKKELVREIDNRFKKYYYENHEKELLRSVVKRTKLKIDVLSAYSDGTPICCRCQNTDLRVLSIDHIEGGGTKHIGNRGGKWYLELKKKHYPTGFQVLCMNCQFTKKHENKEQDSATEVEDN